MADWIINIGYYEYGDLMYNFWNFSITESSSIINNPITSIWTSFASGWIAEAQAIQSSSVWYPIYFFLAISLLWFTITAIYFLINKSKKAEKKENYSQLFWNKKVKKRPNESQKSFINRKNLKYNK